jgi:hypothetical protein
MKKHSTTFWVMFWSISAIFLVGFWFVLEFKKSPANTVSDFITWVPWLENKEEYKSIAQFAEYILKQDNQEKVFLILFQNNMELRPGGGFIGSFGIVKMKNGRMIARDVHDLSNFDGRIPAGIEVPYPMKETLHVSDWKLRDSNWSPDFLVNAEKAEFFYRLGQGEEKFDGIIAINTNVLTSFLKVTGPVTLPDYPGTYDSENAILTLEYQVEQGYAQQGIEQGERKTMMNELAGVIVERAFEMSNSKKFELAKIILDDLNKKDIQLSFSDPRLEQVARDAGWSGTVKTDWKKDYLMMVDANLGAYKSDYYMRRKFDYTIDMREKSPKANLKIAYTHTGKVKDWMTRDYLSYLRVYVPEGAWLENSTTSDVRFAEELGKKYFGSIVTVPLNSTRTFEFNYRLPENLDLGSYYNLLIQKQSGSGATEGNLTVIDRNGMEKKFDLTLEKDWLMTE